MDIYHVWDYGEEIEMLRYYMPNFEPGDPEWVNPDVTPLPETSLLQVFPNPTNGGVTVHLNSGTQNGSLQLYDITGRFVGRMTLQPSAGQTIFQLNLQSLLGAPESSGIYMMLLDSGGIIYNRTITIIR